MKGHFSLLIVGQVIQSYYAHYALHLPLQFNHTIHLKWVDLYYVNQSSIHMRIINDNIIWVQIKCIKRWGKKQDHLCIDTKKIFKPNVLLGEKIVWAHSTSTLPLSLFFVFFIFTSFPFILFIFSCPFLMSKLEFCIDKCQIKYTITFSH